MDIPRCRSSRTAFRRRAYRPRRVITRPGLTNDTPGGEAAPIITASITGSVMAPVALQSTMKLAPVPPAESLRSTTNSVDAIGPRAAELWVFYRRGWFE